MARIVLVMHKPLGAAFAQCAEHVLGGRQPALHVMDVSADTNIERLSLLLFELICDVPRPGSVVLSDLYGATPFNVAQRAVTRAHQHGATVSLLAGANLNMVLKALTDPCLDPDVLRENIRCSAIRGVAQSDDVGGSHVTT